MLLQLAPYTNVLNGKTTVATVGIRILLGSGPCSSITIKALSTNTGIIYVGNGLVTSANGFQLSASESISLDINNINLIYLDTSVNGSSVSYIAIL